MPTLPNGTIHAQVIYYTGRRTCFADLFYVAGAPPTIQAHIQGIANALDENFRAKWVDALSGAATFQGVLASYTHATGDVFFEAMSDGGVTVGAQGDDGPEGIISTLPDEVCAVIRKLTGRAGREDRGRIFLSGLHESFNNEGELSPTGAEKIRNLADRVPMDVAVTVAADSEAEVEEYNTTLHARHWNRKDNVLRPIIGKLVNATLMSRRDRRKPLLGVPLSAPLPTGP